MIKMDVITLICNKTIEFVKWLITNLCDFFEVTVVFPDEDSDSISTTDEDDSISGAILDKKTMTELQGINEDTMLTSDNPLNILTDRYYIKRNSPTEITIMVNTRVNEPAIVTVTQLDNKNDDLVVLDGNLAGLITTVSYKNMKVSVTAAHVAMSAPENIKLLMINPSVYSTKTVQTNAYRIGAVTNNSQYYLYTKKHSTGETVVISGTVMKVIRTGISKTNRTSLNPIAILILVPEGDNYILSGSAIIAGQTLSTIIMSFETGLPDGSLICAGVMVLDHNITIKFQNL